MNISHGLRPGALTPGGTISFIGTTLRRCRSHDWLWNSWKQVRSFAGPSAFFRAAVAGFIGLTTAATTAAAGPMMVASNTSVDQSGGANVSIPIAVPPGTSGMLPKLSLSYSSFHKDGYLGVGWTLTGLPMLVRCPMTIATNYWVQPVTLSSGDVFCLQNDINQTSSGGQKILVVNGTYGANNAVYATEIESFDKIVSYSSGGMNGPSSFKIYDRSGLIYEYGATSGSYVSCSVNCPSSTTYTAWALDKVTDPVGNNMTISYGSAGGNVYPTEIDYTANSTAGLAYTNKVVFTYSSRTDTSTTYLAGQPVTQSQILTQIQSKTEISSTWQPVSTYVLAYGSGVTGASRLSTVTQEGASGDQLAQLQFGYCDGCATGRPDFLTSVTTAGPAGVTYSEASTFTYGLTTHTSLYSAGAFYNCPQNNPCVATPSYPSQNMSGPQYVVASSSTPNGLGGSYNYNYGYGTALVDLEGRGFLGYFNFEVDDTQLNNAKYTQYYQSFPLIGVAGAAQTTSCVPVSGGCTWQETSNTQILFQNVKAYYWTSGNKRTFDAPLSTTVSSWDLQGNPMPGSSVSYTYDGYGNETSTSSSKTQNYGVFNTVYNKSDTSVYQNDAAGWSATNGDNWIIGRVTSDSVSASYTDNNNGANNWSAVTRNATFAPSSTTGLNTTANVEPGMGTNLALATSYNYDAYGHAKTASSTDTLTTRTNSATYGSSSDPGYEFLDSSCNALSQCASAKYDQRFGEPLQSTDINSQTTSYTYDEFGRLKTKTANDGSVFSLSYSWCTAYGGTYACPTGAVYAVAATHIGQDGTTQLDPNRTVYYDGLDRVVDTDVQGFDGTTSRTTKTYNASLQLAHVSQPYFTNGTAYYTAYTFDQLNRLTQINYPSDTNEVARTDTYAYSQTQTIAYIGATTSPSYSGSYHLTLTDADGNLIKSQQQVELSGTLTYVNTTYNYDGFDNLRKVVDTSGNATTYSYDVLGRKTAAVDPDSGASSMTYTAFDEMQSTVDANSVTDWISRDLLGRPQVSCYTYGISGSEEQTCSNAASNQANETGDHWSYDPSNGIGLLGSESSTQGSGSSSQYAYNSLGQPLSSSLTVGANTFAYSYNYDSNHRPASFSTPSSIVHEVVYNSLGYPSQLIDDTNQSSPTTVWTVSNRDAAGNLVSGSWGNGTCYSAAFDPVYWGMTTLATAVQCGSSTYLQKLAYTWNPSGNLTARSDTQNGVNGTFTYDHMNRLVSVSETGPSGNNNVSFALDLLGDMTNKSDVGAYTFPATGHAHAVSSIAMTSGAGGGTTNFTYDADGQILTESGTIARTVTWTLFHQPATVTYAGNTLNFQYDADGNRIGQTGPSTGVAVLLPDGMVSYHTGDPQSAWIWDSYYIVDGQRIASSHGTPSTLNHRYYHNDYQGSVQVVTNDKFVPTSPTTLQNLGYDEYGVPRNANGSQDPTWGASAASNQGYINQRQLLPEHLEDLNARLYDPQLAEFISPDPIINDQADSQAYNSYAYSGNSPLSRKDPSGLDYQAPVTGTLLGGQSYDEVGTTCYGNCGGSSATSTNNAGNGIGSSPPTNPSQVANGSGTSGGGSSLTADQPTASAGTPQSGSDPGAGTVADPSDVVVTAQRPVHLPFASAGITVSDEAKGETETIEVRARRPRLSLQACIGCSAQLAIMIPPRAAKWIKLACVLWGVCSPHDPTQGESGPDQEREEVPPPPEPHSAPGGFGPYPPPPQPPRTLPFLPLLPFLIPAII